MHLQKLMFNGRELSDESCGNTHGIKEGSTITLVKRVSKDMVVEVKLYSCARQKQHSSAQKWTAGKEAGQKNAVAPLHTASMPVYTRSLALPGNRIDLTLTAYQVVKQTLATARAYPDPTRPPTAFFLYKNTHRDIVRAAHPTMDYQGIDRKLSTQWASLDYVAKAVYFEQVQSHLQMASAVGLKEIPEGHPFYTSRGNGDAGVASLPEDATANSFELYWGARLVDDQTDLFTLGLHADVLHIFLKRDHRTLGASNSAVSDHRTLREVATLITQEGLVSEPPATNLPAV